MSKQEKKDNELSDECALVVEAEFWHDLSVYLLRGDHKEAIKHCLRYCVFPKQIDPEEVITE